MNEVNNYKERYEFLCKYLSVSDIDYWENDALIGMEKHIFFQFGEGDNPRDLHEAIELAMGNNKYDKGE